MREAFERIHDRMVMAEGLRIASGDRTDEEAAGMVLPYLNRFIEEKQIA